MKYNGADYYKTANSDIDNIGAEALASANFANRWGKDAFLQRLTLSYCYNYKFRVHTEQAANYVSRMTFLRHKFVASLHHRIVSRLTAQWDVTFKNREGEFENAQTGERQTYGSYATLDMKIQWTHPSYSIYLQANNLTNHPYYDFANVKQPGAWLMAGVKCRIGFHEDYGRGTGIKRSDSVKN